MADARERVFVERVKTAYIPRALESGELRNPPLTLVMGRVPGTDGNSYSLQFYVESVDALQVWYRRPGSALVAEIEQRFSTHVAGFSTLMQKIEL